MKKVSIHCDQCGKRADYLDSDADRYEIGFILNTDGRKMTFRNHCPTSSGHSSAPMVPLIVPQNICSNKCMSEYFNTWLGSLPEIYDGRSDRQKEIPND